MLTSLRLKNFRRFADHRLPFEERTLLVGANNAGKSTVIEALRLVSLITTRTQLKAEAPPEWLPEDHAWGVSPSLEGFDIRLEATTFHRYSDPPAEIEARFEKGGRVTVLIGPDRDVFAVVRDPDGDEIYSRSDIRGWTLSRVAVQPQVGPLLANEKALERSTVIAGLDATRAPRHFRNQLHYFQEFWTDFCRLAEETWPGLRIVGLEDQEVPGFGVRRNLMVRVEDFAGEVGLMGHGLQMWLQLIWFLVRAREDEVAVLDEPDVFMHPDLQRRLIRYLRRRQRQLIIATHSVEMLGDAEPEEVVSLGRRAGRRSKSLADLQDVIEELGSVHSIQLDRLQRDKRFVFVEGKDFGLLDRLEAQANPEQLDPFGQTAHEEAQGWDSWQQTLGAAGRLRDQFGEEFRVYALFDSDYRPPRLMSQRVAAGARRGIEVHVWTRKEIENYLLVPSAIARLLAKRARKPPTEVEVARQLAKVVDGLRDSTIDKLMDALKHAEPALEPSTARERAIKRLDRSWRDPERRTERIPGKEAIKRLSRWSSRECGTALSAKAIASSMTPAEIDPEVRDVLRAIRRRDPFGS